jgi:hypothetical protein
MQLASTARCKSESRSQALLLALVEMTLCPLDGRTPSRVRKKSRFRRNGHETAENRNSDHVSSMGYRSTIDHKPGEIPIGRLFPQPASGENQIEGSEQNGRNLRSTVTPVGSIRLIVSTRSCAMTVVIGASKAHRCFSAPIVIPGA